METKKEKIIIFSLLFISIAAFFAFGLFHLAKFETTDEQLWKYGRIKQYWQSIENHDWKKTYINDKPGITVALVSGAGLFFEPNPETHRISDPITTSGGLFFLYDTSRSEFINFVFRFPILLLSALSLFVFFWLIWRATNSPWLALFSVLFMALNPILVGISQIINPDSFLWIFGGLAIFSYLARLKTRGNKFLILAGIFSGLALLSKYTAFTLFLLFFLILLSKILFDEDYNKKIQKNLSLLFREVADIFVIALIAIAVFSLFLPAVFLKPSYLFKGISQFLGLETIIPAFLAVSIFSAVLYFKKDWFTQLIQKFFERRKIILIAASSLFLLLVVPIFLNVWSGQRLIPFDDLRNAAYANEPKEFNFGRMMDGTNFMERNVQFLLMEAYPFVFSLSPFGLLLLAYLMIKAYRKSGRTSSGFDNRW
jgi:4-amino-4-deoxy-L-arabinose transferase-like glycosyltransferase